MECEGEREGRERGEREREREGRREGGRERVLNGCWFLPRDLGVFIGAMEENGFAMKSEKLKINDRILACNGVDFTKEPYRE